MVQIFVGVVLTLLFVVFNDFQLNLSAEILGFALIFILAGMVGIWFAAEKMLLEGLEVLKKNIPFLAPLVGLAAAAATSGPEAAVNLLTLQAGSPETVLVLAMGNIVFSNLVNISLLGLQRILVAGVNRVTDRKATIEIDPKLIGSIYALVTIQGFFTLLCFLGGSFSKADGTVMTCIGLGFLVYQGYQAFSSTNKVAPLKKTSVFYQQLGYACALLVIGICLLSLAADVFLGNAQNLGVHLALSATVVGLILAFGSSFPELVVSSIQIIRGRNSSLEDVAGELREAFKGTAFSNIINLCFALGMVVLIRGVEIPVSNNDLQIQAVLFLFTGLIAVFANTNREIDLVEGVLLLLLAVPVGMIILGNIGLGIGTAVALTLVSICYAIYPQLKKTQV